MRTKRLGPTVHAGVNYWPGLIDMLTSILMFFLLAYFVEHNFNAASAELATAQGKQARFREILRDEFRHEIASGRVSDSASLNLLQIRLGDGVLFRPQRYALQPEGRRVLARLAGVFRRADVRDGAPLYERIEIEGHTDNAPQAEPGYPRDNWELSTARATEVMRFLTHGVHPPLDEARMSVNGYADHRPVSDVRSLNRRIEIRIFFSGRPAADGR